MGERSPLSREEKLENLISNQTLVFMGVFEEAFSTLAEAMTETMNAGALGAPNGATMDEVSPRIRGEIESIFSDMREEVVSQMPKDPDLFKRYISDPAMDRGIEIVESCDIGRPRLTEKLDDRVLASYVFLLKGGDAKLARMFEELSEWQDALPRPPWAR